MDHVVVDASAFAAMAFKEPGCESVEARLAGTTIHAPNLMRYEMMQVTLNKIRRNSSSGEAFYAMLELMLNPRSGIRWHDVNPLDVAILARSTGLSAYDASYLWLAAWLEADLVTLDRKLAAAADPTENGAE